MTVPTDMTDRIAHFSSYGERIGAAQAAGDWRAAARERMRMNTDVFGFGRFFRAGYWRWVWQAVSGRATR